MRRFAGSCRFVFNRALALQKNRYAEGEKHLGYAALCKELTGWRNGPETPWLSEAPVHPLQQSLRDLGRAYTNFFQGRAKFPRFKKRDRNDGFRYPDRKQIRLEQHNNRIFLPKLGWLRYRNSRAVMGQLRNATVTRNADRWFVSIQTEREVEVPAHNGDAIGIEHAIAVGIGLRLALPVVMTSEAVTWPVRENAGIGATEAGVHRAVPNNPG